jgi:hypothetical protein
MQITTQVRPDGARALKGNLHGRSRRARDVERRREREHGRPRSRKAAAERAGGHRRRLDLRKSRHQRRALRFGNVIDQRSREQREIRSVERGHQASDIGPLPGRILQRDLIADQSPCSAGLDLDSRMQNRASQPVWHRQADDVGRLRAPREDEAAI